MVSHVQGLSKNEEKNSFVEGRRELGGLEKTKTSRLFICWLVTSQLVSSWLSSCQARRQDFLLPVGFCCLLRAWELSSLPTLSIYLSIDLIYLFYCSGFCHTLKWNSHGFTCVPHPDTPSPLPLHPIPLGLPSAPGPSACLMHPTWAGDLFHPR